MKEEYDLKQLRVKRRGAIPGLQPERSSAKIHINIALDQDIIEHFKAIAKEPGALSYQAQINQALRNTIPTGTPLK